MPNPHDPPPLVITTGRRRGKTGCIWGAGAPFVGFSSLAAIADFKKGSTGNGAFWAALSLTMVAILIRNIWPYYRNEYSLKGTTLTQRVGRKRYLVCDLRTADISADSIPATSGSAAIPRIIVTAPDQDSLILPLRSNPDNTLLPAQALLAIADAITTDRSEQHLQEISARIRRMAEDPFGLST